MNKKHSLVALVASGLMLLNSTTVSAGSGEFDAANQYPGVGAIIVPDFAPFPICSGVLVDELVFLTAGHCTDDIAVFWEFLDASKGVWVSFQPNPYELATCHPNADFAADCGWVRAADVLVGDVPAFNPPPWAENVDDIGALILASAQPSDHVAQVVNDIDAIEELLQGIRNKDIQLTAVGYGGTPIFPGPAPAIAFFDIRIVNHPRFLNLFDDQYILTQQNPAADNTGSCAGDSGGPLFLQAGNDEILIGLVNGGPRNCISFGVYYRLDTPLAQDFLAEIAAD